MLHPKELVIVGAGPHALTLCAWLLEEAPDSSVDERWRLVFSKQKLKQKWQQQGKPARRAALSSWLKNNVAVIDERGNWNARWSEQFDGLDIPHLRSPMSVHPDPGTSSALTSYAQLEHRCSEMVEMKFLSKSTEFHGPFWLPGTKLFSDFSASIVHRYCLDGIVLPKKVLSITPEAEEHHSDTPNPPKFSSFTIHLSDGTSLSARRVVVAVGSTNIPRIPSWAADLRGTPDPLVFSGQGSSAAASTFQGSCGGTHNGYGQEQGDVKAEKYGGRDISREGQGTTQQQQQQVMLPRGVIMHAWEVASIFACMAHGLERDKQLAKEDSSRRSCNSDHLVQGYCIGAAQASQSHCCSSESSSIEAGARDCSLDSISKSNSSSSSSSSSGQGSSSACSLDSFSDCETCVPQASPSCTFSTPGPSCDVSSGGTMCTPPTSPTHECLPKNMKGYKGRTTAASFCVCPGHPDFEGARIVLVGGGLTAAQMALLAMKHGCKDCIILMRAALKVKQFDVNVGWLGRDRQRALKAFNGQLHEHNTNPSRSRTAQHEKQQQQQQADEGAVRLAALKAATGGGSMSPEALRLLMPYIVAGHVKLVEHEEIIAAGWDDEFCWGGSKNDAHKQGAWELLLASTGTRMRPKAVAKALQDAETPPHMHGHSKPHHSHAHSRSHTHKLQGGHSGESSSEEDLLGQFAPQHVHSSESFHSVHHSAPPGSNSSRSSQGTLSISSNSSSSCTAEDGMLHAHHVWLATGSVVDVRAEPVFSGLMAVAPVPVHGGMPMLQEDLRWHKDMDCFVLGAYAALRLGPGAANLMGARTAAVKVTAALKAGHGGMDSDIKSTMDSGMSSTTRGSAKTGSEGGSGGCIKEGGSGCVSEGRSESNNKREAELTGSSSSSSTDMTVHGPCWDAGMDGGSGATGGKMGGDHEGSVLGGLGDKGGSTCKDANNGGDWLDQLHRVVAATRGGRGGAKDMRGHKSGRLGARSR